MFAITALFSSAALPDSFPTGRYWCAEVRQPATVGQPWLLAELEENRDQVLLSKTLTIRMSGYRAVFNLTEFHSDRPLRLKSLELETWVPPSATTYPVTVKVSVSGAVISTQIFARPNVTLVDFDDSDSDGQTRATGARKRRFRPAVTFTQIDTSAHLFGASGVEVTATDKEGLQIAQLHLPSPNWSMVAAYSATTFSKLEAARSLGQCHELVTIIES